MKSDKLLTVLTLDTPGIHNFAEARNALLRDVSTPWVLFLDGDEDVPPELDREIRSAVNESHFSAFKIHRQDTFLGRVLKYGETGSAKFIRLAKRDFGTWERPVHETWVGSGEVGELRNPLQHAPHETVSSFLEKINNYSTIDAGFRFGKGMKSSIFRITFFPPAKFIHNYFWKLGILDGVPGLIMALMMSFHSFLTWSKLFILWQKR